MRTEKEIVYSILNSLRGSHSGNNESISNRLIRSWIASERANILLQFTDAGRSINEENFQSLPTQTFTKVSGNLYISKVPKILYFNKRSGIRLRHQGDVILMCTKSQDRNYQQDMYFKGVSRAWNVHDDLYIRIGDGSNSVIDIDIDAVLYYPADSAYYSWESTSFPLQSELIKVLKQKAIESEHNIINMAMNDQTNNFKSDNGAQ